jgi:hypothetical protein
MALYTLGKAYHNKLKELGSLYLGKLKTPELIEKTRQELKIDDGKCEELNLFRQKIEFAGGGIFSFRELAVRASKAIKWIQANDDNLTIDKDEQKLDIMLLSRIEGKSYEVCRAIEKLLLQKDKKLFDSYHNEFWKFENKLKTLAAEKMKIGECQMELYNILKNSGNGYIKVFAEETVEEFLDIKNPWFELDFDIRDKLLIRKAIDIGVEKVVLQTIISMDGDITTRVSGKFAQNPQQFVLDLHNTSIDISVSFWNKLFDIIVSFGRKIIDKVL